MSAIHEMTVASSCSSFSSRTSEFSYSGYSSLISYLTTGCSSFSSEMLSDILRGSNGVNNPIRCYSVQFFSFMKNSGARSKNLDALRFRSGDLVLARRGDLSISTYSSISSTSDYESDCSSSELNYPDMRSLVPDRVDDFLKPMICFLAKGDPSLEVWWLWPGSSNDAFRRMVERCCTIDLLLALVRLFCLFNRSKMSCSSECGKMMAIFFFY